MGQMLGTWNSLGNVMWHGGNPGDSMIFGITSLLQLLKCITPTHRRRVDSILNPVHPLHPILLRGSPVCAQEP